MKLVVIDRKALLRKRKSGRLKKKRKKELGIECIWEKYWWEYLCVCAKDRESESEGSFIQFCLHDQEVEFSQ